MWTIKDVSGTSPIMSPPKMFVPAFAVAVTKDLNPGMDAAKIAKQISSIVSGSGGGQPHSATGGGKDASRLGEALEAARQIVREHFDGGRGAS